MKKLLLTLLALTAIATTTNAQNTNLGGYDSTEPYNPTPTYDYYDYD